MFLRRHRKATCPLRLCVCFLLFFLFLKLGALEVRFACTQKEGSSLCWGAKGKIRSGSGLAGSFFFSFCLFFSVLAEGITSRLSVMLTLSRETLESPGGKCFPFLRLCMVYGGVGRSRKQCMQSASD